MDIKRVIECVSPDRLQQDLFYLCNDPLPFRKVNYTVPGQEKCSLDMTDDFIQRELEQAGLSVVRKSYQIQAFRCDSTKPLHHWYSKPDPDDPWHPACNLETTIIGSEYPDEIIQLISHKDSMSWIDSPGAHDNASGTVANLEIARALATAPLKRSVRILFCNEEHTPWTSRFAAEEARERGDTIIAVLNQDSLDGKSDADLAAGRLLHTVAYSTEEGHAIALLAQQLNDTYGIGLDVDVAFKERVNDDDGMFINAGFRNTIMNLGSFPYSDSEYHLVGDRPERVNIDNLAKSTQLVLATILALDTRGTLS